MRPADFYTGIVADLYAPLKAHAQPAGPYAAFIAASGQPALELGCGDGDPLIELRQAGLDVEGVDSSPDMLARCSTRAAAAGVDVTVHHQAMEELDLPRRYASIYLAGPTFTLLPDDGAALAALRGIGAHLDTGGTAMVPLFVPEPTAPDQVGAVRTATGPDGARLAVTVVAQARDETARTQTTVLRYEVDEGSSASGARSEERPWVLHWHTVASFHGLARDAGLAVRSIEDPCGRPAADDADEFVAYLQPAQRRTSRSNPAPTPADDHRCSPGTAPCSLRSTWSSPAPRSTVREIARGS